MFQLVRTDTTAGIDNAYFRFALHNCSFDTYRATFRELNGIADQIMQNLNQSVAVCIDRREMRRDAVDKLDLFVPSRKECIRMTDSTNE